MNTIQSDSIKNLYQKLGELLYIRDSVYNDIEVYTKQKNELESTVYVGSSLLENLRNIIKILTAESLDKFQDLVNESLRFIFDDRNLQIVFKVEDLRGSPSIGLYLIEEGREVNISTNTVGGGLLSVIDFILRFMALILSNPPLRLLVLDEAFNYISARYAERLAYFITNLCQRYKVDCLLITHKKEFLDGSQHAYRVYLDDNNTAKCEKLK